MKHLVQIFIALATSLAVLNSAQGILCTGLIKTQNNWVKKSNGLDRLNKVLHLDSLEASDQEGLIISKPFKHYSSYSDQILINGIDELSGSLNESSNPRVQLFEIYALTSELLARLGVTSEIRRMQNEDGFELFLLGTINPGTRLSKVLKKISKRFGVEVGMPKRMILNRLSAGEAFPNAIKISLHEVIKNRLTLVEHLDSTLLHEIEHVAHMNSKTHDFLVELAISPSKKIENDLISSYKNSFPADELEAFLGEFFRLKNSPPTRVEAYTVAKNALAFYDTIEQTLNHLEADIHNPYVERHFQITDKVAGYQDLGKGGITLILKAKHRGFSTLKLVNYVESHIRKLKAYVEKRKRTVEILKQFILDFENQ